jgi:hypothetical protein
MTDRMNPAEISEIEELLKKLASLGMVRRNDEIQDGQPVYEVTKLGQRVIPEALDDAADKPLQGELTRLRDREGHYLAGMFEFSLPTKGAAMACP